MEKIVLYYYIVLNNLTLACGENIKLLLVDAGLEHEYVRLEGGESWKEKKKMLEKEKGQGVQLKRLFKTVPVMRYISAKLNYRYHGSTPEENHFINMIPELVESWLMSLKNATLNSKIRMPIKNESRQDHVDIESSKQLAMFNKYYLDYPGPFLVGEKIIYADFLINHMLDDDDCLDELKHYPQLATFVEAFKQRPNLNSYLASLRH
ncbi:uncharacterized protein B0P05DRAFT_577324 [Gilbertella persicaria]|uniref:uncharacterized protein n=1 Tax=Gilbertella persicaria TaxID=101096 RepID=UPI00221FCB35|nr:uncharacterized protein B0P05DRAFT_577324 [Gilbertella persicaria]KAI8091248.1 hypothetical protein B0P05DRAFT_577324 [Gilbertella persicaria]